jgi:hypothetical protein
MLLLIRFLEVGDYPCCMDSFCFQRTSRVDDDKERGIGKGEGEDLSSRRLVYIFSIKDSILSVPGYFEALLVRVGIFAGFPVEMERRRTP